MNKITDLDPEAITMAEDLFCRLSNMKYLSKIDLTKGYWQIPVAPEDVYKTAFVTPDGQYEFLRMPFGMVKGLSGVGIDLAKLNPNCHVNYSIIFTEISFSPETYLRITKRVQYRQYQSDNLHLLHFYIYCHVNICCK